ncbi:hypothetical protein DENIS_4378 [Desulfonema ishimotonii]|uniref:KilA-N DNA-binding domain-containing protein n=1 Tax=Desulfonema ishimotonii TaxID=45657 RepID=A0A401G2E0_9BACT|nr:ORF6N domain-containing protein [Desulfonema ishimotonii]GBC63384.1 hypothetical protein DENIS_4378 [Desulfonema ishimotonii]
MSQEMIVNIEGKEIERMKYRNQPVVTLRMIDELHQRPEGTARKAFNRHRNRFIENIDFFEVPYEEWEQIADGHEDAAVRNEISSDEISTVRYTNSRDKGQRNSIKFITESGYLMIVKPFKDDLAWKIQRALVQSYFTAHEERLRAEGMLMPVETQLKPAEPECDIPLEMLASKMTAAMQIAQTLGIEGHRAALSANRAVRKATGYDCIEIMDAKNLFKRPEKQLELPIQNTSNGGTRGESEAAKQLELPILTGEKSGKGIKNEKSESDSPTPMQAVGCFVEDMCIIGSDCEISKEELFYCYTRYCSRNGYTIQDDAKFLEALFQVITDITMRQSKIKGLCLDAARYAELV